MTHTKQVLVPLFSSEAGLCLTSENWLEAGISTVSYNLDALLLKPGMTTLKQINDLKSYLAWPGQLVLNASQLVANKAGVYTITSSFDGSKLRLTSVELVDLILHLKPDLVLLPQNLIKNHPEIWPTWDDVILPIVSDLDAHQTIPMPHGIYYYPNDRLMDQLDKASDVIRYVCGDLSPDLLNQLKAVDFIESDTPARDALQGLVYSATGTIDLKEVSCAQQFEPIDSNCSCSTCKQHLTKAYLHHLFQHTPLLCQRLLIQHNLVTSK